MTKIKTMFTCCFGVLLAVVLLTIGLTFPNVQQQSAHALDPADYVDLWIDYKTEQWVGSGTSESPYIIDTAQKLAQLAHNVNTGVSDYANTYFRLRGNIDLMGHYWVPIGNETHPFRGVFRGMGNTISNMFINAEYLNTTYTRDFREYLGLFGYVENTGLADNESISQITFQSPTIYATEVTSYAGVVAGYFNGIKLEEITINAQINEDTTAGAYISHYLTTGGNMSSNFVAGGLVGLLGDAATVEIANDSYSNEISTNIESSVANAGEYQIVLGGLVGESRGTINESYRTSGEIKSYIGVIGGLVGRNSGTIKDCYNAGIIQTYPNLPSYASLSNEVDETIIGGLAGINSGTINTQNFTGLYPSIASQNVAQSFQTCRGSIGGLVGLNQTGGVLENLVNTTLVKCTGTQDGAVQYMGGIVAVNAGTVRSCQNLGNIESDGGSGYKANSVGGIAGLNDSQTQGSGGIGLGNGMIIGCQNEGNILNIDANYAGGIAGTNATVQSGRYNITAYETNGTPVSAVSNSGQIRGVQYAGGIVGYNFGRVNGAYNIGTVSGTNSETVGATTASVGGIVGRSYDGEFSNCFNAGTVGSGLRVGGFAGQTEGSLGTIITNAANYGNVTGESYAGGFVGYSESGDFSYIFSIGDVDITAGSSVRQGIGGLIGGIKTDTSGTHPENTDITNGAYSSSIANYQDSLTGNYDNGMNVIGNFAALFSEMKYISYNLTLPFVASNVGDQFYPFYQLGGSSGTPNTNWYFAEANTNGNTYYYPVLRAFKTGETNSLNIYPENTTISPISGQLSYPSEVILKVEFYNNLPRWDSNAASKVTDKIKIGETQYIVYNQYVAEPTSDTYTTPQGFDLNWKTSSSDLLTNPVDWSFNTRITTNRFIFIDWTEQVYTLSYYMQDLKTGEITAMDPDEVARLGLLESVTYSLDPSATVTLVMITDNPANGYRYNGWWCYDTLPDAVSGNSSSRLSVNQVFKDGVVYVVGTREAKTYPVQIYPGVDRGNDMNFEGHNPGEPITVTLTYGEVFNLSEYAAQLVFDSANLAFKGWYDMEQGGSIWAGPNSISVRPFDHNAFTGGYRLYAQWTGLYQTVYFVTVDSDGVQHELTSISVPFGSVITSIPSLVYYIPADAEGFEVAGYYSLPNDETAIFDFEETLINDTTYVYVTWQKKYFNLILNADGGEFVDGSETMTISVEYQDTILDVISQNLPANQRPTKLGFTIHLLGGSPTWTTASGGQGTTIGSLDTMPSHEYTIYIMWDRESYTITFIATYGNFADGGITTTTSLLYGMPLKTEVDKVQASGVLDITSLEGYGFKYWSLTENGDEITDEITVPVGGLTLYAVMGKQVLITFKKFFTAEAYLNITIFEGETVPEPEIDENFNISGYDFAGWSIVTGEDEDGNPTYENFDFSTPLYQDTILCAQWQENTDAPAPVNTNMGLMISLIIIAVVVVLLFVFIMLRSRKKDLSVHNKRLQTKDSKEKLEQIRKSEEKRNKDNPFADDF